MTRTRNDLPFVGCRRAAATALTAAVMTIFTGVSRRRMKTELERCASPVAVDDDTNAFTGGTEAALEGVLETIGRRLRPLRRVR